MSKEKEKIKQCSTSRDGALISHSLSKYKYPHACKDRWTGCFLRPDLWKAQHVLFGARNETLIKVQESPAGYCGCCHDNYSRSKKAGENGKTRSYWQVLFQLWVHQRERPPFSQTHAALIRISLYAPPHYIITPPWSILLCGTFWTLHH